jgi:hypothetical protein
LLTAFATIGTTTPRSSQLVAVKVAKRHAFAVCTGLCPNFDLQVRADGRVELRRVWFDDADEYRQYRVSTRKAATFFQMLDKLRPADGQDVEETNCGADVPAAMKPLYIDVTEIEIVWLSTESAQHLEGCQTDKRIEALRDALRVLGLYSDGRRIKK